MITRLTLPAALVSFPACATDQPGDRQTITQLFEASVTRPINEGPATVYPKDPALVVLRRNGALVVDQMTWGFPVQLRGKTGNLLKPKPVNNARFDKLWGGLEALGGWLASGVTPRNGAYPTPES